MKEQEKYEVIKELADHNGNKKRAALKLNLSVRQINRLIHLYREKGKDGFVHHNKHRQPVNSFPQELSDRIVNLYQGKYQGFNFAHFKDLLQLNENIDVSYSYVYRLLNSCDILSVKAQKATKKRFRKQQARKRNPSASEAEIEETAKHEVEIESAHPRRQRKKYFGEEIQMDGSIHLWFGLQKSCLHLAIDNCTGIPVGAYFDTQETLNGYYHVFKQILKTTAYPSVLKQTIARCSTIQKKLIKRIITMC